MQDNDAFSIWLLKPVVLHVKIGEMTMPLCGTILRESRNALRIRLEEGWEIDLYKDMVAAIKPSGSAAHC